MPITKTARAGLTAAALVALAACTPGSSPSEDRDVAAGKVTLVTHDSWAVPKSLLTEFERQSGYTLEVLKSGDAGQLTNKLVLTKDDPIGDVAFGIDNTFASRALEAGVLAEHDPVGLPEGATDFTLAADHGGRELTPIDWGDVCVNVDDVWFDEAGLEPPQTLDDLVDPAYEDLFVTPGASTSSPGFAFLLATVGAYGEDGWQDYWRRLMANGARVVSGWSDAYLVDFTAGGGDGDRPIVVSYASSPPFTIPEGEKQPSTSALLDTCFRQVEYAGVLAGSDNPQGAAELVDFMTTVEFQEALPDHMYVFPVDGEAELPPLWERWAVPATDPIDVDPDVVDANRDDWLREWSDVTAG